MPTTRTENSKGTVVTAELPRGKGEILEILPMGEVDRTAFDYLALGLRIRFGRQVEIIPDQQLPSEAFEATRNQWLAREILRSIRPRPSAWRTLAVVGVDLFAPGLGFVFGEADPTGRKVIFSLERLRPEHAGEPADRELLLGRSLKEAVHEVGHTCGLPHCRDRFCVMRFSNSLSDTDLKRDNFCDRCRRSIARTLAPATGAGVSPRNR
jgi:archaemetzincin